MIHWEEEYSVGIEEIDVQHIWLFDFMNNLEDELNDKDKQEDIGQTLELLGDYCKRHFKYEEDCMDKWKCPVAGKNKCAHDQFLTTYENFRKKYNREGNNEVLAWEIHDTLEQWLSDHICKIDVQLRACKKMI